MWRVSRISLISTGNHHKVVGVLLSVDGLCVTEW